MYLLILTVILIFKFIFIYKFENKETYTNYPFGKTELDDIKPIYLQNYKKLELNNVNEGVKEYNILDNNEFLLETQQKNNNIIPYNHFLPKDITYKLKFEKKIVLDNKKTWKNKIYINRPWFI